MVTYICYGSPWGRGGSKKTPVRELPEWLKLKKEKSGKCKDLRRKVARLRNVNASESHNSWSLGYGEECKFFRLE